MRILLIISLHAFCLTYLSAQTFDYKTYFDDDSTQIRELFQISLRDSLPQGAYQSFSFQDSSEFRVPMKMGQPMDNGLISMKTVVRRLKEKYGMASWKDHGIISMNPGK